MQSADQPVAAPFLGEISKTRGEWQALFSESSVPILSGENQTPVPRRLAEERFGGLSNGKGRTKPPGPTPSAGRYDLQRDAGVDENLVL